MTTNAAPVPQMPPTVQPLPTYGNAILLAVVALVAMTVTAVVLVAILVDQPTNVIALVIGVSTPVTLGLLGVLVNNLTLHVNSRWSAMEAVVRESGRAEGRLEQAGSTGTAAADVLPVTAPPTPEPPPTPRARRPK